MSMIPESGIMVWRHQRHVSRTPFWLFSPTAEPGPKLKIKGELRAILRLRWTALKTNWCRKMRIDNTALKLARFIHTILRKNVLNSWQFPEYFGIFLTGWSHRALLKIPPLYLRKHLLATAGNLKVNEQSRYKSVPIFFFLAIERKPEMWNYWIFEPVI